MFENEKQQHATTQLMFTFAHTHMLLLPILYLLPAVVVSPTATAPGNVRADSYVKEVMWVAAGVDAVLAHDGDDAVGDGVASRSWNAVEELAVAVFDDGVEDDGDDLYKSLLVCDIASDDFFLRVARWTHSILLAEQNAHGFPPSHLVFRLRHISHADPELSRRGGTLLEKDPVLLDLLSDGGTVPVASWMFLWITA